MSALQYDNQGFILGVQKSLDKQLQHQKAIKHDTALIIRLLQGELAMTERQIAKDQAQQKQAQAHKANANIAHDDKPRLPRSHRRLLGDVGDHSPTTTDHDTNTSSKRHERQNTHHRPRVHVPTDTQQTRHRDERGRFVGAGNADTPDKKDSHVGKIIANAGNATLDIVKRQFEINDRNIDPLLNAVHEVNDFLSPVTGTLGKLFGERKKLPKEKERFYHKLHKKLRLLADRLAKRPPNGANLPTLGGRRGLFGKLLGSKLGKGLLVGITGMIGVALSGLFGGNDNSSPKQTNDTQTSKPPSLSHAQAKAKQTLTHIGAGVDKTLTHVAKTQFGSLTTTLTQQKMPERLLTLFALGLSPFFKGASTIFDWVRTQVGSFFGLTEQENAMNDNPTNQPLTTDTNGEYQGGYTHNKAYKGGTTDGKPNNVAVYEAYRKAGLTHEQALGITAEVGRENNFESKHIFGYHVDAAKDSQGRNIVNMGMLSWNRERQQRLQARLTKKGLFVDGKLVQSQATIDEMAKFSVEEMQSERYKGKLSNFWNNPHADPESYARELGKNYVVWAYGQDRLRGGASFNWKSHDNRRRGHLNTTKSMVVPAPTPSQQAGVATPTATAKPVGKPALSPSQKHARSELVKQTLSPAFALMPVSPPPAPPVITQSVGTSSDKDKTVIVGQNAIGQNVSDDRIAYAVTGGIGQRQTMT